MLDVGGRLNELGPTEADGEDQVKNDCIQFLRRLRLRCWKEHENRV